MPAATTKTDLLAVTEKDFAKLEKLLATIEAEEATKPHPVDGVSIKDTILHRVHWIGLFLGWYRDGVEGKTVETPAPGYKWNELKAYNARIREETRSVDWATAQARLHAAHADLVALVNSLDEAELYGPKRYDWLNQWTLGRWAEASGASHYRSAAKYIRQVRRALQA